MRLAGVAAGGLCEVVGQLVDEVGHVGLHVLRVGGFETVEQVAHSFGASIPAGQGRHQLRRYRRRRGNLLRGLSFFSVSLARKADTLHRDEQYRAPDFRPSSEVPQALHFAVIGYPCAVGLDLGVLRVEVHARSREICPGEGRIGRAPRDDVVLDERDETGDVLVREVSQEIAVEF